MNNRSRGHVTSKYWALSWKTYLCLHKTPCYKFPYKWAKFCTEWKATQQSYGMEDHPDGQTGPCWGAVEGVLHSLCPPSSFSESLDSHHFSISSIVQNIWGAKGKRWALNCSLVPRGYNIQSEKEFHSSIYMSFLKQPATPTFTWHLWKHVLWGRENEFLRWQKELQLGYCCKPCALESAMVKCGNTEFCNELLQ